MQTVVAPIIRSDADLEEAIERATTLFNSPEGSPERDELDVLVTLIEAYENRFHPIDTPTPAQVIRVLMEERNLSRADLAPVFGGLAKVSEVLSGKRALSKRMIRELHVRYNVPYELLMP